jgi:hypothetical protein
MKDFVRQTCLTDVQYAIRQLRKFGDVARALDALERVEERLANPEGHEPDADDDSDWMPDDVIILAEPDENVD